MTNASSGLPPELGELTALIKESKTTTYTLGTPLLSLRILDWIVEVLCSGHLSPHFLRLLPNTERGGTQYQSMVKRITKATFSLG